jgi:hypothetical protein
MWEHETDLRNLFPIMQDPTKFPGYEMHGYKVKKQVAYNEVSAEKDGAEYRIKVFTDKKEF